MRASCLAIVAALLTGCTFGPNYKRPQLAVPANFRAPEPLPPPQAASLADLKWFEVFQDEKLQDLIRTALVQNFDLRDAVTRVEQARSNLGITRSNQIPQVSASGDLNATRTSRDGAFALPPGIPFQQNRNFGQAGLNFLSFELDIWGRLRRATEAARADLLNAEETRKAVVSTLVSQLAADYLQLRELDYELEISETALKNRQDFLQLTQQRQVGGVATLLDLRQAEQLVETAAASIPTTRQQIEQTENQIDLLLGQNPGTVSRGRSNARPPDHFVRVGDTLIPTMKALIDQHIPDVPVGLPSALLERRPDIRAAEQALVAANANIGVAKAAYFPQITLTGSIGGQSSKLSNLFSGPNGTWSFVPQLTQPIFTAGRLRSNVHLAEAQRDQALVAYERSIQTAFSDVSNALIAHQRTRETRLEQERLVATLEDRKRLAYVRYQGGVYTQLNALDADRDLFTTELTLAQVRYSELVSVVQLYKALGGG